MPQLVIVDGPQMGRTYALDRVLYIDAKPPGDLLVHDGLEAGRPGQTVIASLDGGCVLRNLDRTHTVRVNGEPQRSARLRHGDMIEIGGTQLLFSEDVHGDSDGDEHTESHILSRQASLGDARSVIERLGIDSSDEVDRRLVTLYRINALFTEATRLDELLEHLLEVVVEELGADRAFVMLSDDDPAALAHSVYLDRKRGRMDERPSVSQTLLSEVVRLRQGVVSTRDDQDALGGRSIASLGIVSTVCVPLVRQGRLYGVLGLDSLRPTRVFGEHDLDYLSLIAGPAAAAIATLQTYEEPEQFSRNLAKLAWAIQQLSGNLERDELIKEMATMPCSVLRCRRSSVMLSDGETGKLRLAHARGIDRALWSQIEVTAGEGPSGHVLATGEPLLVPGDQDPAAQLGQRRQYQTDSYLIVPIRSGAGEAVDRASGEVAAERLIGVLCVTDKLDGRRFTRNDQELLAILGHQAGIALGNAELYEKATVDNLTRLHVRRYFFQRLAELVRKAHPQTRPLSLLMLDLDHFKALNDTFGHLAGDAVLREAGGRVHAVVRKVDVAARYGGEEFAVILPDTGLDIARTIGERVRSAIGSEPFRVDGAEHRVTVSIGAAQLTAGESREQLIQRADAALYRAKERGRNQVVLDEAPSPP